MFFQRFKEEERIKMNNWAFAEEAFLKSTNLNEDLGDLTVQVLSSNNSTPMILTDPDGEIIDYRNIDREDADNTEKLKALVRQYSQSNEPIVVRHNNEVFAYLYYGDSAMLQNIKYFPFAIILIVVLFGTVIFLYYSADKNAEQNLLWAGMAKETAHQIGTPLSSLVGWVEILKQENVPESMLEEIKKDLDRLNIITDRFSKVGSMPALQEKDLVAETQKAFGYVSSRSSKLIRFESDIPEKPIRVKLNTELYNWTIENLVKNGIDAMRGKGRISLRIEEENHWVHVLISDTGSGIPKHIQKQIFKPGFTTKTRGWGLGLSLAKRIIEDYHQGQLRIKKTEVGKGSVMQISLRKV
jgi:signal transduction histidine kinase